MIVTVDKYERLLTAIGRGAWGRLDFDGDCTNLRVADVRQFDGYPRVYFNGQREQVITGVRYQPMTRVPFGLISGVCYKITTNVEFIKPIPKKMFGLVVSTQAMVDAGLMLLSAPMMAGYKGLITFSVLAARSVELDSMVVGAHLMMFDASVPVFVKVVGGKSSKSKIEKLKGKKDEDGTSGKSSDGGKTDGKHGSADGKL